MKNISLLIVILFTLSSVAPAPKPGDKIYLRNPSFEDSPRPSDSPVGWHSYTAGSTPDILPGPWEVKQKPKDGRSYVGLITREDGSSEDIAQLLPSPMRAEACYKFSIYLAHTNKYVGYNQPIRLRVWGGTGRGGKEVLLATSPLIDHADWRPYTFQFITPREIRYLTFEASYGPGVFFYYKGNILLDSCSVIEECDRA